MVYRSSTEGGYGIGVSTDHVDASHADRIDIPDAELLFRGHFARSGPDLVLTGQDGHRFVVTGYFASEKHPDLVAPNGAHLYGDLVDLLGRLADARAICAGGHDLAAGRHRQGGKGRRAGYSHP